VQAHALLALLVALTTVLSASTSTIARPSATAANPILAGYYHESPNQGPYVDNISAEWIVPRVSCPSGAAQSGYNSTIGIFVGIDGFLDSNYYELSGMWESCHDGKGAYKGWYVFSPGDNPCRCGIESLNTVDYKLTISPGDLILATVDCHPYEFNRTTTSAPCQSILEDLTTGHTGSSPTTWVDTGVNSRVGTAAYAAVERSQTKSAYKQISNFGNVTFEYVHYYVGKNYTEQRFTVASNNKVTHSAGWFMDNAYNHTQNATQVLVSTSSLTNGTASYGPYVNYTEQWQRYASI
jgi:hypothetical protein